MAIFSTTNASAFIPEVWDTQVLQARYAAAEIMPLILNKSSLVKGFGDIIHIPVKLKFAGGTVQSDGTFTAEVNTPTDVSVTVDTWKYVALDLPDQVEAQSMGNLDTELPSQFGEQLAVFYDIALANRFASLTGTAVGSSGSPVQFVEDAALTAVLNLRIQNIPLKGLKWVLPPEAFYLGWFTKERMTNANTTGESKSLLTTNYRGPILNIPAYESTLLAGSTGNVPAAAIQGALLHTESLAIAMQINNKYEKTRMTAASRLATLIVAQNLFGTNVVRADHGSLIYINSATA